MALTQSLVGSVLIVGWTYRLMQRFTLQYWWKRSRLRDEGQSFEQLMATSHLTAGQVAWPNWVVGQDAGRELRGSTADGALGQLRLAVRVATRSLRTNLKVGIQGIFNTWVLTMPGCLLWLFAWYDGWNNSFAKGYEQAAVGPLTGVLGVILFIAAMFYVPMAQARQASTGQWSSFYQFRLNWSLIRRRWLANLGLAFLYSLVSVPVTVLKFAPQFFPQINPASAGLDHARVLEILSSYFFWCALFVFPACVFLRLIAARIYASALLASARRGNIPEDCLAEIEWETLHRLDLLDFTPPPRRHAFVRMVTWAGTRIGRATVAFLLVFVWFTFVAQIFTAQFIKYQPVVGWLNQPLVQLPWFRYIPSPNRTP